MSSILLVTSSPRGAASHSTRVATELAARLREANPASRLVVRDLVANPLPHIDPDYSTGIYTPAESRTQRQADVVAVSDAVVDELIAADTIILATGFINFNIFKNNFKRCSRTSFGVKRHQCWFATPFALILFWFFRIICF